MYVPILFFSSALSYLVICFSFFMHHSFVFSFFSSHFSSFSVGLQACRERIKGRQAKIAAFTQRMNLINQRGTPDQQEMTS
jgi:hypothetical protein